VKPSAIEDAPELAGYQDQPAQLPAGASGKRGFVHLGFVRHPEKTVLADLERQAPLLVQQALYFDEGMPELACVYIISTGGGILQGDRAAVEIHLEAGARAYVSTQSATKIHEMDANFASQAQDLVLGEEAYLEYLPEPTIPFRHSRFLGRTRIRIAPSATLLYGEVLLAGRKYHGDGECFAYDVYSSYVRAERPDGRELFVEKLLVEPVRANVRAAGVMGTLDVFANVFVLTPKEHAEHVLDLVPPELDLERGLLAAATRLPNDAGLVYKIAGCESEVVNAKVRELWSRVRPEVTGRTIPERFAWR
jgi:urease accessory protein